MCPKLRVFSNSKAYRAGARSLPKLALNHDQQFQRALCPPALITGDTGATAFPKSVLPLMITCDGFVCSRSRAIPYRCEVLPALLPLQLFVITTFAASATAIPALCRPRASHVVVNVAPVPLPPLTEMGLFGGAV